MILVGHVYFVTVLVWRFLFLPGVLSASFRFADNLQNEGGQTLLADVAPLNTAAGSSGTEIWSRSDFLISTFWKNGDGFSSSHLDDDEGDGDGMSYKYTYGEVTTMGVRQLAHALFLDTTGTFPGNYGASVFYDLGSGVGRLVAQMYLDRVVQRAVGVELSEERHRTAVDVWGELTASLVDRGDDDFDFDKRAVEFIHGDVTDVDLSDATHIYISSLCFADNVIDMLQDVVLAVASSCTSKISVVAALSELEALEQAGWIKTVQHIQMTWGGGLVRIYTRPTQCHL